MYLGLEYTYDIIQTDKVTIGVSPGIGYDRITTLTIDNDYGEEAGFVSGFNKNAGLVLTYRFGDQGPYAGLHVRYNWVSYDNPGGTFLDGGYLNIRLVIGSISDYWQKGRLKSME